MISPPKPKNILPQSIILISLTEHPKANNICPINRNIPTTIKTILFPNFVRIIPPMKGSMILGILYTEYNKLK